MGIKEATAKKAGGVVYTPEWLADLVINQVPSEVLFEGVCADISCGEGALLIRLCHKAWQWIQKTTKIEDQKEAFRVWAEKSLWGSDIDAEALKKAHATLDAFARKQGFKKSEIKWQLYEQDALDSVWRASFKGQCKVMVGNPPYVRVQHLSEKSRLETQKLSFSSKGATDLYLSFYEIGLECLAPEGYLAFIAPNSWIRARAGKAMRVHLAKTGQLKRLIDFKDYPPFEGVGAYCAIALMLKKGGLATFDYEEWDPLTKKVKHIGPARSEGLAGALPMPALLASQEAAREQQSKEASKLLKKNLNADAKSVVVQTQSSMMRPKKVKEPLQGGIKKSMPLVALGKLCRFSVGFATLADEVFITEPMDLAKLPMSGPIECQFNVGKRWIERECLRPLIKASIAKKPNAKADRLVVFPYELKSNGKIEVIGEARMKATFPLTEAYLQERQERLNQRDRGKPNPHGFRAFGRSQGLISAFEAWVVSPMLAKEPQFCVVNSIEHWDAPAFIGGLGIRFEASASIKAKLLALLNSTEMATFVSQAGADYRGGYKSYAKTVIEHFPVDPAKLGIEWFEKQEEAHAWLMIHLPIKCQPKALSKTANEKEKKLWNLQLLSKGKAYFKDDIGYAFKWKVI